MARKNIINLRYADDISLMVESKKELKTSWWKWKSEKVGLKLNSQKTKIMASSPIISWQINEETMETVSDFIFGMSKSLQMMTAAVKLRYTYYWEEKLWPT